MGVQLVSPSFPSAHPCCPCPQKFRPSARRPPWPGGRLGPLQLGSHADYSSPVKPNSARPTCPQSGVQRDPKYRPLDRQRRRHPGLAQPPPNPTQLQKRVCKSSCPPSFATCRLPVILPKLLRKLRPLTDQPRRQSSLRLRPGCGSPRQL